MKQKQIMRMRFIGGIWLEWTQRRDYEFLNQETTNIVYSLGSGDELKLLALVLRKL